MRSNTNVIWISPTTWKCERHVPSGVLNMDVAEKCRMCSQTRPDASLRPSWPEEAPAKKVAHIVGAPHFGGPLSTRVDAPCLPCPPVVQFLAVSFVNDPDPACVLKTPELDAAPTAPEVPTPILVITALPPPGKANGKHICPGPKCRKASRPGSPFCSKVCGDRAYKLRKKAEKTALTDQENRYLTRIRITQADWEKAHPATAA